MIIKIRFKILFVVTALILAAASVFSLVAYYPARAVTTDEKRFIKWVDFNVCYAAMDKSLKADVNSLDSEVKLNWIEILSYLAVKYGGNFSRYKSKDMDNLIAKLNSGISIEELTKDMKYYNYYYEAYSAILGGFVGPFSVQEKDPENPDKKIWVNKYGLKAFSPIARGYGYSHYDDFGNSRSYGFKRVHLGNDMMGSVGTPIIAVESGYVEALGWNQYGGWRIGIRSHDKKRYYYYAHLKKDHPYVKSLKVGDHVKAGDVIGYLGMTGYSSKENVNNINVPHLHFGMQLVFDESQKEALAEIWIDVYHIVNLLNNNRSAVVRNTDTKDFERIYDIKFINEQ